VRDKIVDEYLFNTGVLNYLLGSYLLTSASCTMILL